VTTVENTKKRTRVQHVHYGWLGERKYAKDSPEGRLAFVLIVWDDGTQSHEHPDDLIERSN
jgi:hypothetical protein